MQDLLVDLEGVDQTQAADDACPDELVRDLAVLDLEDDVVARASLETLPGSCQVPAALNSVAAFMKSSAPALKRGQGEGETLALDSLEMRADRLVTEQKAEERVLR